MGKRPESIAAWAARVAAEGFVRDEIAPRVGTDAHSQEFLRLMTEQARRCNLALLNPMGRAIYGDAWVEKDTALSPLPQERDDA